MSVFVWDGGGGGLLHPSPLQLAGSITFQKSQFIYLLASMKLLCELAFLDPDPDPVYPKSLRIRIHNTGNACANSR